MEAASTLQIQVQKGPKSGETLACNPQSTTRIGRVIKGNDFALRDPGVSQQHLRFEFLAEASGWFVTDLESSNGTSVNGVEVEPFVNFQVRDGDVVKIGDKTELVLKIEEIEGGLRGNERRVSGRVRATSRVLKEVEEWKEEEIRVLRSRRNVKAKSSKCGVVVVEEEEQQEELGGKKEGEKCDLVSDLGEIEGVKEEKSRVLRGRRKNVMGNEEKKNEALLNSDSIVDLGEIEGAKEEKSRVLKGRRKKPRANNEEKKNEILPKFDTIVDLGAIEKGQKRRGRAKKNELTENSSKISEEKEEIRDSVAISCLETEEQEEVKLRRNPRRARVLKDLDGNSNRKITRGKGKQIRVSESEEQKGDKTVDFITETKNRNDDSDSDCVLVSDLKNEGKSNVEKTEVDFEKMTLGEWFDRMELILPQIISDESEQIKNILRAKAQKLNEFLKSGDEHKGN